MTSRSVRADGTLLQRGRYLVALAVMLHLALEPSQAEAQVVEIIEVADAPATPDEADPGSKSGFAVTIDETLQNALADFRRHAERKSWEKAFRSLDELPPEKRTGLLPRTDGLLVPAGEEIWGSIVTLPPEGRAAFRVFFDPKAKQLDSELTAATEPGQDVKIAGRIFDQYFLTSVGDKAADLLGDAAFERGRFAEAARYWGSVLEHHPDSELSELRLQFKRALALLYAGRTSEFDSALRVFEQRFPGETLQVGSGNVRPAEYLASLRNVRARTVSQESAAEAGSEQPLSEDTGPAWQLGFLSEKGEQQLERSNSNDYYGTQNGLANSVPSYASDGGRIFCNWIGICFAVDVATGKLAWRSGKFGQLHDQFGNLRHRPLNIQQYAIAAENGTVLAVVVPLDQLGHYNAPFRLTAYDAADGKVRWQSEKLGGLASESFLGRPVISGKQLFVLSHPQNQTKLTLRCLRLDTGEPIWSQELGIVQNIQTDPWGGGQKPPVPVMLHRQDDLFILTGNGALLHFDLKGRQLVGVLRYARPIVAGRYGMMGAVAQLHPCGNILERDGVLYFKEANSDRLYAYDPGARKLLWERPAPNAATLFGADDDYLYLADREVMALDRREQKLAWSVSLPIGTGVREAILSQDALLVFTSRGIFELERASGSVRKIVRGADLSSFGGAATRVDGRIVSISNRALTAYPLAADGGEESAQAAELPGTLPGGPQ